ncbi:hypothetical protein [Halococcus sp. IIIV-5B]|uniref:hypothetical protein n=1 Tax=Halococcus sp. IIIV-5B TaxID=2321230 RepID=UPI0018F61B26|nr:hypothetical protein [Halococcus sp. IIIV-5B]
MAMKTEEDSDEFRRAILTKREREIIGGDEVDDESYRYQAASRVRNKIQRELPKDIDVLRTGNPKLLSELREIVNEDDMPPSPRVGSDPWAACVAIAREGYHDCEEVAPVLTALTDRKWDRSGASKVLSAACRDGYADREKITDKASRSHNARYEYTLKSGIRLDLS